MGPQKIMKIWPNEPPPFCVQGFAVVGASCGQIISNKATTSEVQVIGYLSHRNAAHHIRYMARVKKICTVMA